MIVKILLYYLLGYVKIQVEGYFIERFMNRCKAEKILLWNVKRESTSLLQANIGIPEFKQLRKIASKTKCKVKIKTKKGVPFLLHRYQKRKLFFLLLILLILGITQMSGFVWNIEVKGNETIDSQELLQDVKDLGLTLGKHKGKIDTKRIVNDIRLKRDDLAWVGIHLKGTNAVVEVVEADKKPEIINENEYCNIVSDKEGVIVKVDAQTGTALVKPGDVIKPGTVLVGGWIEGKYTGVRYVHAKGEIKAKVWYTAREKVDLKQTVREQTGQSEKKYRLEVNNFQINLYKKLSKFQNYDTMETTKKIKIFSNFYLPVGITECNNFEIIEKEEEYSIEQAKQMGQEKAEQSLLEQIPNSENIQDKTINAYENGDSVEVEVTYEVLENIGTNEKIVF